MLCPGDIADRKMNALVWLVKLVSFARVVSATVFI